MFSRLFKYELIGRALNAAQIFITLKFIDPVDFSRINLSISYILFIQVLSEFSFGRYQQSKNINGISKNFLKSIMGMSTVLLGIFSFLAYQQIILTSYFGFFLSALLIYLLPITSYLHQTIINNDLEYFSRLKLLGSVAAFIGFLLSLSFGFGAASYLISMITSASILLISMLKNLKINASLKLNRQILFYCGVTTLTAILAWVVQYIDLTILRNKISASDMGSYGLANNIAITVQAIGLASIVPVYSKAFSVSSSGINKYLEYFLRSSVVITLNIVLYVTGGAILLMWLLELHWKNISHYIVVCVCLKVFIYQMGIVGDYLRIRYGTFNEFLLMICTSGVIFLTAFSFDSIDQIYNIRILIFVIAILTIIKIHLKKFSFKELAILMLVVFIVNFFDEFKDNLMVGTIIFLIALVSDYYSPRKISMIKRLV